MSEQLPQSHVQHNKVFFGFSLRLQCRDYFLLVDSADSYRGLFEAQHSLQLAYHYFSRQLYWFYHSTYHEQARNQYDADLPTVEYPIPQIHLQLFIVTQCIKLVRVFFCNTKSISFFSFIMLSTGLELCFLIFKIVKQDPIISIGSECSCCNVFQPTKAPGSRECRKGLGSSNKQVQEKCIFLIRTFTRLRTVDVQCLSRKKPVSLFSMIRF